MLGSFDIHTVCIHYAGEADQASTAGKQRLLAWMVLLIPVAFAGGLFSLVLAGVVCETDTCTNPAGADLAIWALGVACVVISLWFSKRRLWLGGASVAFMAPVVQLIWTIA